MASDGAGKAKLDRKRQRDEDYFVKHIMEDEKKRADKREAEDEARSEDAGTKKAK